MHKLEMITHFKSSTIAIRRVTTVVVGMSGGVDSSVAACILKKEGYNVIGVHMRNWNLREEGIFRDCTHESDWNDVKNVCSTLGVPCHSVDFSKEYWHDIFQPSLENISNGMTPNPDAICNVHIKFGVFRNYALSKFKADFISTGHYAQLNKNKNQLLSAEDRSKDQTYFLSLVPLGCFENVLFPIGSLRKWQVRNIAAQYKLTTALKKDSVGLCFVGKRKNFGNFLMEYIKPTPGLFICGDTGKVLGEHNGLELYTIGQKARIPNMTEKYYISGKNLRSGNIEVVPGAAHPLLMSEGLTVRLDQFNWLSDTFKKNLLHGNQLPVLYQIRYNSEMGRGLVWIEAGLMQVRFFSSESAVAPGQVVALYDFLHSKLCIGGGPILKAIRSMVQRSS